jgi:hypothetical protein
MKKRVVFLSAVSIFAFSSCRDYSSPEATLKTAYINLMKSETSDRDRQYFLHACTSEMQVRSFLLVPLLRRDVSKIDFSEAKFEKSKPVFVGWNDRCYERPGAMYRTEVQVTGQGGEIHAQLICSYDCLNGLDLIRDGIGAAGDPQCRIDRLEVRLAE